MRVSYTFYFSDEERRAIAHVSGESRKASRGDFRVWLGNVIAVAIHDVCEAYDESKEVDAAYDGPIVAKPLTEQERVPQ